jgi:hypothetical protein
MGKTEQLVLPSSRMLGEQRYGHMYLIGGRGYQFTPANLPLSRSL